jgi:hypothetical protein
VAVANAEVVFKDVSKRRSARFWNVQIDNHHMKNSAVISAKTAFYVYEKNSGMRARGCDWKWVRMQSRR